MAAIKVIWGALCILAAVMCAYDLYGDWSAAQIGTRWAVFVALFLISVFLSGVRNMLNVEV